MQNEMLNFLALRRTMGRYHIYIYLEKPQLHIFIPAHLIWELHAELFGHLVRVKRISCSVLLVEEVNLVMEETKCIEEFSPTLL